MCGAIGFNGPAGQEQAYDDTQNNLFLPGQALHVNEISTIRAVLQCWIETVWHSSHHEIEQFIRDKDYLLNHFSIEEPPHFVTGAGCGLDL